MSKERDPSILVWSVYFNLVWFPVLWNSLGQFLTFWHFLSVSFVWEYKAQGAIRFPRVLSFVSYVRHPVGVVRWQDK